MDSQSSPQKWKRKNREQICATRVFGVNRNHMQKPDGTDAGDFFTLEAPDWVIVLAFDTKGDIILVEQYRHGIDDISLEIPGGVIDSLQHSPLQTAMRELLEETGYSSQKWKNLGAVSSNPALLNNWCHVFLALECTPDGEQDLDTHEDIAVHTIAYADFCRRVYNGDIHHALAVAALAKYLVYLNAKSHE